MRTACHETTRIIIFIHIYRLNRVWNDEIYYVYCFQSIICSIEVLIKVMSRKIDTQATHRQGSHCSPVINPFFDSDQMGMRARPSVDGSCIFFFFSFFFRCRRREKKTAQ